MWMGSPLASLSCTRFHNFLAMSELGYVCWREPLFDTTSAAVYGLLMPAYLGVAHHASTSLICCS